MNSLYWYFLGALFLIVWVVGAVCVAFYIAIEAVVQDRKGEHGTK